MRKMMALCMILMLLLAACKKDRTTEINGNEGPVQTRFCYPGSIIDSSVNLSGHIVVAECNPGGGTNCPCSNDDVSIASFENYGEVTSNVKLRNTYVNAIGYKKFIEVFPSGDSIALCRYKYSGQFQLPVLPKPNSNQTENPQAIHLMIQLWDGQNTLFNAANKTLEATIYYELNPWDTSNYGKIKIYRNPAELIETGIRVVPDTAWHSFELVADFKEQKYVSISIDGQIEELNSVELARVYHPDWGNEVALNITTESLASWPQSNCNSVFTWTTRFRNLKFQYN